MKFILDTNVISELIARNPHERVVQWVDDQEDANIYLSVMTIGEIQKGIVKLPPSQRKDTLFSWLRNDLLVRFDGRILGITIDVMLRWGELTATLEQAGKTLSAIDSLIAALALHGDYAIVTRNEDDFKDIGVTVINPWKL